MLEVLVIFAFIAVLMTCVMLDISIVYALAIGYFIFFFYGVKRGFGMKNVFFMSVKGVKIIFGIFVHFTHKTAQDTGFIHAEILINTLSGRGVAAQIFFKNFFKIPIFCTTSSC